MERLPEISMDDELLVTEQLDLVELQSERAEQEAREEEDLLLFGIDFGQRSIDDD